MRQEELSDRRQEALPNPRMFGWLSIELLIGVLTTIVLIALSYGTLAERVETLKESDVKEAVKVKKVQEDVSAIRVDVEVIKTLQKSNQQQSEKQFEEIRRKSEATEYKLDQILSRLPERG